MKNMANLEPKGKIEQGGSQPKVGNTTTLKQWWKIEQCG
jgi:hypothetical protein